MKRITWYALLAVVALVVPTDAQTRSPQTQMPKASVRELATIDGDVKGWVRLPSGMTLIYTVDNNTFAYDVATKRRTLLGTDMYPGRCRRRVIDLPSSDPPRTRRRDSCGLSRSIPKPASRPDRRSA